MLTDVLPGPAQADNDELLQGALDPLERVEEEEEEQRLDSEEDEGEDLLENMEQ